MWINVNYRTPNKVGKYKIKYHYPYSDHEYEGEAEWDSEIFITKNLFVIVDEWCEE